MRIAVVGKDVEQVLSVQMALMGAGYSCFCLMSTADVVRHLGCNEFDLLVLQYDKPGMCEKRVIQWVRKTRRENFPVICFGVLAAAEDIVSVLSANADDYIVMPAPPEVLLARVNAVLRRSTLHSPLITRGVFPPYEFNPFRHEVSVGGGVIRLAPKEFELAMFMFEHVGTPMSRPYIAESLWGNAAFGRSLGMYVHRIRARLALYPRNGYRLLTIYGFGYQLVQVSHSDV